MKKEKKPKTHCELFVASKEELEQIRDQYGLASIAQVVVNLLDNNRARSANKKANTVA